MYGGRTSPCPLKIIIIGAGVSGLSAAICLAKVGHTITVLESRSDLREIGAGIQIAPNTSRLLIRWGLKSSLDEVAVHPENVSVYRYDNGSVLGFVPYGSGIAEAYGAPYYCLHRRDLIDILHNAARPLMKARLSSKVTSIDPATVSVTLHTGEILEADLIIGADGINSITRNIVAEAPVRSVPSGQAAFRATIDTAQMLPDPDLRPLAETPQMNVWLGPHKHVVGYGIGRDTYNFAILHEDDTEESMALWTRHGDIEQMKKETADWEPRVSKLLNLVTSSIVGSLKVLGCIRAGRIALIGDACHPMLPYRAQAASMAIEDAAVLGNLFVRITDKDQIPTLLDAYENLRRPRATETADGCWTDKTTFQMEDGPEQRARDNAFKAMIGKTAGSGQDNDLQYGYDADAVVNDWWKEHNYDFMFA
ncbi:uncharacterized protein EV420DRAFT_1619092 [Desarmillaria tabescens]|uniref:FAD-binding domain-containing protein n=1 Tax=Armillaria tabescens TaxID=1929756 RepID=A0AA39TST0_ARMTA|nr:uncharacterized protein EV420DRAFT_1619092 [Desarmillaria tabescens]KAK0462554.1 hypothetical protein EV420DRAFT_1619092 [Desarmillaria tabescens]